MREAPLLAALSAMALVLAGCTAPSSPAGEPLDASGQPGPGLDVRPGGVNLTTPAGNVSVGLHGLGLVEPPTLDAPPRWIVGEWWRIKVTSLFTGDEVELTRVVADIDGDTYVVGMPHEEWIKEAILYHAPGFGDVNMDLSYDTHDHLFQPVKFPLTADQTWTTEYSGSPELAASVEVHDDLTATITFTSDQPGQFGPPVSIPEPLNSQLFGAPNTTWVTVVYDAKLREVKSFQARNIAYEVLDHGFGYEGWVTIPRGEDLVFFNGRFLGAGDVGGSGAAAPVETVELAGGYNRVTFFVMAAGFGPFPGAFREQVKAPDGTEYVTQVAPAGPTGNFQMQFFEHADPDGAWEFTHAAAGFGFVFTEGIAYHQYDIQLPGGAKRMDHSHEVIR